MGGSKAGTSFPSSVSGTEVGWDIVPILTKISGREERWDLVPIFYKWERRRRGAHSHPLYVGEKKA